MMLGTQMIKSQVPTELILKYLWNYYAWNVIHFVVLNIKWWLGSGEFAVAVVLFLLFLNMKSRCACMSGVWDPPVSALRGVMLRLHYNALHMPIPFLSFYMCSLDFVLWDWVSVTQASWSHFVASDELEPLVLLLAPEAEITGMLYLSWIPILFCIPWHSPV